MGKIIWIELRPKNVKGAIFHVSIFAEVTRRIAIYE